MARLRVVSYFSLQGYCTRAEKPRAARNEDVWWFPIALDEIRTRRILREKADCKQSTCGTKCLRVLIFAIFKIRKNKFPQIKITANIFPEKLYTVKKAE